MVNLTTRAILALANSLSVLEQSQGKPYKFVPGVRMIMAKNLIRTSEISVAYYKERNNLILVHADGSGAVKPENMALFAKDDDNLLSWLHEIDIIIIKEDQLKLDDNDVPIHILAGLAPMIDGMREPVPKIKFTL
jgi:hypothetical protein